MTGQHSHIILALASFAWATAFAAGFINVPEVRKPALKSTSTSVTWEPTHVLIDNFRRNPFADEESTQVAISLEPTAVAEVGATPSRNNPRKSLTAKYIQAERTRRKYQRQLKTRIDNFLRDSGLLRSIADSLVTIGIPSMAKENPEIISRFLQLTRESTRIPYGTHKMQGIDMFFPDKVQAQGLLFFVHGGAWGSGQTWMYRMVAKPFLDIGMAVAIVGYRTFPDGDMNDQVQDLELAAQKLLEQYPDLCRHPSNLGVCLMGHSSGAHIAMSMLTNRLQQKIQEPAEAIDGDLMKIDSFCGLSAPYEISSHFEFETGRGVEQISPMLAACGYDTESLSDYSPVLNLFRRMICKPRHVCAQVNDTCPRIILIHGDQDDTVPLSSTQQAAQLLKLAGISKCEDICLSETGHSETVLQLMFGGKTQDTVMEWLLRPNSATIIDDVATHDHAATPEGRIFDPEPSMVA